MRANLYYVRPTFLATTRAALPAPPASPTQSVPSRPDFAQPHSFAYADSPSPSARREPRLPSPSRTSTVVVPFFGPPITRKHSSLGVPKDVAIEPPTRPESRPTLWRSFVDVVASALHPRRRKRNRVHPQRAHEVTVLDPVSSAGPSATPPPPPAAPAPVYASGAEGGAGAAAESSASGRRRGLVRSFTQTLRRRWSRAESLSHSQLLYAVLDHDTLKTCAQKLEYDVETYKKETWLGRDNNERVRQVLLDHIYKSLLVLLELIALERFESTLEERRRRRVYVRYWRARLQWLQKEQVRFKSASKLSLAQIKMQVV